MKIKDPELYKLMKGFLTAYLTDVKQKSVYTIHAYRDALNLYMEFLDKRKSVKLKDACISDFNQKNVSAFLRWLHDDRGNESSTINQRLSHIKEFCRYIQKKDVLSFETYSEICEIAEYKDERTKDFIWLTVEDVKLILGQPDINKKTGIRDRFFICLMYESGCQMSQDNVQRFMKTYEKKAKDTKADLPHLHVGTIPPAVLYERTQPSFLQAAKEGYPLPYA